MRRYLFVLALILVSVLVVASISWLVIPEWMSLQNGVLILAGAAFVFVLVFFSGFKDVYDLLFGRKEQPGDRNIIHGDIIQTGKTNIAGGTVHIDQIDGVRIDRVDNIQITYSSSPQFELAPPEPTHPPEFPGLVGRTTELRQCRDHLAKDHLVVITGTVGVGKTALAARLVQELDQVVSTFWHTFKVDQSISTALWKLAEFLAHHEQPDLWRLLNQSGVAIPTDVQLDYIVQNVQQRGYLLCFDDFHLVDDDPIAEQLVQRLGPAVRAGAIDIVIVAQQSPIFVFAHNTLELAGLRLDEMRSLMSSREIVLNETLLRELHRITDGNAQLLCLALNSLQDVGSDPESLLSNLSQDAQIGHYLIGSMIKRLNKEELQVMRAAAVLMDYPDTSEAISAVLDNKGTLAPLSSLRGRSLLTVQPIAGKKTYRLNALAQVYLYDGLEQSERQRMHRNAARYYAGQAPGDFRVVLHNYYGQDYNRAVQTIGDHVWDLLNHGWIQGLRRILDRLQEQQLEPELTATVLLALGQVCAWQGEGEMALQSYERANWSLNGLDDSMEVAELRERKKTTSLTAPHLWRSEGKGCNSIADRHRDKQGSA